MEPIDYNQVPEIQEYEKEMIERVRGYTITSLERMWALIQSIHYINRNNIQGDVVECGVFKGGSVFLSKLTQDKYYPDTKRDYFLFDTFCGMSEPEDVDVDIYGVPAKQHYKELKRENHVDWAYATEEEVRKNAHRFFENIEDFTFVKGKVEETLLEQKNLPERISILRLDTDFYESTKKELEILYPRISPGGVLIVDDYGHFKGAQKAVDEYFSKENPFLHRIDYTARLIIKPV